MQGNGPIEILLVEDNAGDVRLTRKALKESKVMNTLHVLTDGDEALEFLRRQSPFEDAVRPDLILLDLNLPKKDGLEVLAEVKSDAELRRIPVVILTTSQAAENILQAYDLHANAYIIKPFDFDRFIDVIKTIEAFWFRTVKLAHKRTSSTTSEDRILFLEEDHP
ncbi:MAG: response regulator [Actinomycetota bacterium]